MICVEPRRQFQSSHLSINGWKIGRSYFPTIQLGLAGTHFHEPFLEDESDVGVNGRLNSFHSTTASEASREVSGSVTDTQVAMGVPNRMAGFAMRNPLISLLTLCSDGVGVEAIDSLIP
jgi:hypothetical protein